MRGCWTSQPCSTVRANDAGRGRVPSISSLSAANSAALPQSGSPWRRGPSAPTRDGALCRVRHARCAPTRALPHPRGGDLGAAYSALAAPNEGSADATWVHCARQLPCRPCPGRPPPAGREPLACPLRGTRGVTRGVTGPSGTRGYSPERDRPRTRSDWTQRHSPGTSISGWPPAGSQAMTFRFAETEDFAAGHAGGGDDQARGVAPRPTATEPGPRADRHGWARRLPAAGPSTRTRPRSSALSHQGGDRQRDPAPHDARHDQDAAPDADAQPVDLTGRGGEPAREASVGRTRGLGGWLAGWE